MVEYTLTEKIKTLSNMIFSSSLFLILLIGILVIVLDAFWISRKSKKVRRLYLIVSILLVLGLSINYIKELISFINEVNKAIVEIVNFPSMLEYLLTIFITLIIMLYSIFNKKVNKVIKSISIGISIADTFIFFLILDQISKDKIDLSSKIDIYKNQNLMILFEISMFIFIIWILILLIYKICKKLINSRTNEIVVSNNLDNQIDFTLQNKEVEQIQEENEELEDIEIPILKNQIVNFYDDIEMPKMAENVENKNDEVLIDGLFTIEEYRKLRDVLKNKK